MFDILNGLSCLSSLWKWRWLLVLSVCCLLITACASALDAPAQPTAALPVLESPPLLATYHVFVTDIGNGDLAELGKGTVTGGKSLHGLALSPDGHVLYATDIAENRVDLFDVTGSAPRLLRTVAVGLYPVHVAFGSDGRFAYVSNFQGASVSVVDVARGTIVTTIQTPAGPHGLAASPDGRFIYVACLDGQALAVIDTSTNSLAQTLTLPANTHPYSVVFGKEGRYLYITDNFMGRVLVVDTTQLYDPSHAVVGGAAAGQTPVLLTIAPDGKRLYVTNSGGNLTVLSLAGDPTHPKRIAAVPVGRSPHGVAISPDGRYVVVANIVSGNLSVIDTSSNRVAATIKGEKNPNDVLITPG
jgi:YVTN family beta-propeller protein